MMKMGFDMDDSIDKDSLSQQIVLGILLKMKLIP